MGIYGILMKAVMVFDIQSKAKFFWRSKHNHLKGTKLISLKTIADVIRIESMLEIDSFVWLVSIHYVEKMAVLAQNWREDARKRRWC